MKQKTSILLLMFAILQSFTVGCIVESAKSVRSDEKSKVITQPSVPVFHMPKIPSSCQGEHQKCEYLVEYYWRGYNFRDTLWLEREYKDKNREIFNNFITLVQRCDDNQQFAKSVKFAIDSSLDAGDDVFNNFVYLFETYLYNPNSPFRNEEQYIIVLNAIINNKTVDSIYKIRPKEHLKIALKNRVGQAASNFEYTLRNDVTRDMYSIKTEYTILYFNNPDCSDCNRVKEFIANSQTINSLHQAGELAILSVYTDPTLNVWREAKYPDIMIDSYDKNQQITDKQLYDLKAIPTVYLLDKEKNVILKDAPIERVDEYLKLDIADQKSH